MNLLVSILTENGDLYHRDSHETNAGLLSTKGLNLQACKSVMRFNVEVSEKINNYFK